MFKVGRTLVLTAGFTAFAFMPAAMMLAPAAHAQTMGEYGATVGSGASSAGSLGGSIGGGTANVGGSVGGGLNMGVATGSPQPEVVSGHGASRTIIIGGGDTSHYSRNPTREDDADDSAGDDWEQVR